MPAHKKSTPERYCEFCDKPLERKRLPNGDLEYLIHFNRRKFCGRLCMAQAFDARETTDNPSWATAHYHARKLIPPGPCARCGALNARDVHHKDGNHQNNSPENLERICRSCHNLAHSKRKPCAICGEPQKGLGYCEKHYQRFKKYGDPLKTKRNQHTPVRVSED